MNTAARIAVARDSAVVAPRAPNTVPEAPAPKPAPASAPLPRCISTSHDTSTESAAEMHDHQSCMQHENPSTVQAAATIARNSSDLSEAPPIRPPSTSGMVNSSRALPALTLPP